MKNVRCIVNVLSILLICCGIVQAEEVLDKNQIVEKLKLRFEGMNDYSATIRQEKRIALFNSSMISTGLIMWKKSGSLFIAMNPPDASQIFLSGSTLWLYYPDEKVAQKYVLKDKENKPGFFSFCNPIQLVKPGNIQHISISGDSIALDLSTSAPLFKKISLCISNKDWLIQKLELVEKDGDSTVITYSNALVNSGIADQKFRFVPPQGVTVSSVNDFKPPWQ
jgi:chaperone LolA